jgi:chorismate-pyruvate lyase
LTDDAILNAWPGSSCTVNAIEEFDKLTSLFPERDAFAEKVEYIPASTTPEPYKTLLVHDHHMTVAMEEHHRCRVDVKVLDSRLDGEKYARKILLTKEGTDEVVQFGIVTFDFQYVTRAVKEEILSLKIPLGRVLINHNVLRHVDLNAILRITVGPALARHLQVKDGDVTYGRVATIFCNQQPAIDLLEVSTVLT